MRLAILFSIGALAALGGCAGNQETIKPEAFLAQYNLALPSVTAMTYCSSHDCLERTDLSLSEEEWGAISQTLSTPPQTSAEERVALSKAVAFYEKIAAAKAGTSGDRARTGLNNNRQLDCIDESLNTTTLLLLLKDKGLIRYHSLSGTEGRGSSFDWPHFATSLKEKQSGDIYILDSWFRDNGQPADVLPLAVWKDGWNPPGFK